MQGESDEVTKALADGDLEAASAAGLEPKRQALLAFCRKITFEAAQITEADIHPLKEVHGYSDEQIGEAVYIAALFAFFNRVADAFGIVGRGMINMPVEDIRKYTTRA